MNTALAWRLGAPALLAVVLTWVDLPSRWSTKQALELRHPAYTLPVNSGVVALGAQLFSDENLSVNRNQSCRSCHDPSEGFAAPSPSVLTRGSVAQGSIAGRFGTRRPATLAYATLVPVYSDAPRAGGNNWDGRATGQALGNPAADHAVGSLLNPMELALPDAACAVLRVRDGDYVDAYRAAWGDDILRIEFPGTAEALCSHPVDRAGPHVALSATDRARVDVAIRNIAHSLMAYEASSVVNKFSSRFDDRNLTTIQERGAQLFNGRARCAECHPANVVFSDAGFYNVGVPKNPENPVYNYSTPDSDPGLGGVTGRASDFGKFRTPTVRNVAAGRQRTFMHNGALKSLKQVVDFFNTRDVLPACTAQQVAALKPIEYGSYDPDGSGPLQAGGCWPRPETPQNLGPKQLGNLGLTEAEVDAVVAFLKALRDL